MKDDAKLSADDLALLGALAASDDAGHPREQPSSEHGELDAAMTAELAAHRSLVRELRALPERAPSPNWRALEASIRQACDEVPLRRSWWHSLRDAWRLPALGLGGAAMAALALLLWARAPKPVEAPLDGAPRESAAIAMIATETLPPAASEHAASERVAALYLDDEVVDDFDEGGVDELMKQLPEEAAFALGTSEGSAEEDDELLPGGAYDDEIDQLDDDALRALDQWLESEQKG